MTDFTAEAEDLFRDFARKHGFSIEKVAQSDIELMMRAPRQKGLSFELILGLQNSDELNIGFEGFWSCFFPFEAKRALVCEILDALAAGECRMATHRQFGRVVKRALDVRRNGVWEVAYVAFESVQLPFLGAQVSYLANEDARSR